MKLPKIKISQEQILRMNALIEAYINFRLAKREFKDDKTVEKQQKMRELQIKFNKLKNATIKLEGESFVRQCLKVARGIIGE